MALYINNITTVGFGVPKPQPLCKWEKMKFKNLLLSMIFFASPVFSADGLGKINTISFSGENFGPHPEVVQFELEGGFSNSSCNRQFAAVKISDMHLVSAVLAAKLAEKSVGVSLDPALIYYDNGVDTKRCIATFVYIE
ncbi:MAG: hypothetical protein ACI8SR_002945 [Oceanicoccus sp.]|jgi:hypothetical protein